MKFVFHSLALIAAGTTVIGVQASETNLSRSAVDAATKRHIQGVVYYICVVREEGHFMGIGTSKVSWGENIKP